MLYRVGSVVRVEGYFSSAKINRIGIITWVGANGHGFKINIINYGKDLRGYSGEIKEVIKY